MFGISKARTASVRIAFVSSIQSAVNSFDTAQYLGQTVTILSPAGKGNRFSCNGILNGELT